MEKEKAFPLLNLWCRGCSLDDVRTRDHPLFSSMFTIQLSVKNITIAGKCSGIWNQCCMQNRYSLLALFLSFCGLFYSTVQAVTSHSSFSQKLKRVLFFQVPFRHPDNRIGSHILKDTHVKLGRKRYKVFKEKRVFAFICMDFGPNLIKILIKWF